MGYRYHSPGVFVDMFLLSKMGNSIRGSWFDLSPWENILDGWVGSPLLAVDDHSFHVGSEFDLGHTRGC